MRLLLTILGIAYAVCPFDFFPDFFVGVGWIDDLLVLGLLWWFLYSPRRRQPGYAQRNSGDLLVLGLLWWFLYSPRRRQPGYAQRNSGSGESSGQQGEKSHREKQTSGRKDPYNVLGLNRGASQGEIKKAYLALANRYHPDKVLHLGEEFRDMAEMRFKEIQGAYQELKLK